MISITGSLCYYDIWIFDDEIIAWSHVEFQSLRGSSSALYSIFEIHNLKISLFQN